MTPTCIRFVFDPSVPLEDVVATLLLARWGAESLHGEPVVALEAPHRLDPRTHECVIEAAGAAGRDLVRLFYGYLRRELAPSLFRVERCPATAREPAGA